MAKSKPDEMPAHIRGMIKSYVEMNDKTVACDEIKIHPISKHAGGGNYKCTYCEKEVYGVPLMATALITVFEPITKPHPPRFVFHVGCLPRYTKVFRAGGYEDTLKKRFPSSYKYFIETGNGLVPANGIPNQDIEAKPKPPAWEPLKPKKKPLSARLKKMAK